MIETFPKPLHTKTDALQCETDQFYSILSFFSNSGMGTELGKLKMKTPFQNPVNATD